MWVLAFLPFLSLDSHHERTALSFSIDDTEETEVPFRQFTLDQAPSYVRYGGWFVPRDWFIPLGGGTTAMEISTHPSGGKFAKSYRAELSLGGRAMHDFWYFQIFYFSPFFVICTGENCPHWISRSLSRNFIASFCFRVYQMFNASRVVFKGVLADTWDKGCVCGHFF